MKTLLISASMLLLTSSAFAKMAIYNNESAAKAVLEDINTMAKIKMNSPGDLTSILISSSGELTQKQFTVRVVFTAKTPIGDRSCFTDVSLASVPKSIKLTNGAKISTNTLEITKVSTSICQK